MRYISLNNTSLSYFRSKTEISELSGSSTFRVNQGVISKKIKSDTFQVENDSALKNYLQFITTCNSHSLVVDYILKSVTTAISSLTDKKNPTQEEINRVDKMIEMTSQSNLYGAEFVTRLRLMYLEAVQKINRYQKKTPEKKTYYQLNKSKVKSKLFALFNLKISKKYIAFITVTFPEGTTDDSAFVVWNYFLTACRKRYQLTNYLWISERQKNGTIHYHMLTNNRLPTQQSNRALAIIINNQVNAGNMNWGNSSLLKYNGLDIDAIYSSKRHKKTGKLLNPTALRNWILQYVTKYVTKNSEKYSHLSWHCSHSVSQLFTAQIYEFSARQHIINQLPTLPELYEKFSTEFNITYMFKFVPIESLFDRIRIYNDMIMIEFEPQSKIYTNDLNFKSKIL